MAFVHIHTPTFLLPKNYSQKLSHKFKIAKIKCFLRFSIAKIQPKSKKNRQISVHAFQVGSKKKRNMLKIF